MRKLIYMMNVTLDGFIEGPNHELNWGIIDREYHLYVNDLARQRAFLYGRRVYELMTLSWPTADSNPENPDYIIDFARIWKNTPKIVFSKTLDHAEWNTRLIQGNMGEEIPKLLAQSGDFLVGGSISHLPLCSLA